MAARVVAWERVTRRGTRRLEAKERYLRSDLDDDIISGLVLDTNVFLHEMDLVESISDKIVVTQTAFEEVRHRDRGMTDRLVSLLKKPHVSLFANEHCAGCAVDPKDEESPNDRNDRAIRAAAKYLKSDLVSDDRENRVKFSGKAMSCKELCEHLNLDADLLSSKSGEARSGEADRDNIYRPHAVMSDLVARLSDNFVQGTFRASRTNPFRGVVLLSSSRDDAVFLDSPDAVNRAIDGDVVVVEISPEEDDKQILEEEEEAEEGPRLAAPADQEAKVAGKRSGRVAGVVSRKWRSSYAGSLVGDLFVPVDRRIPKIRIETRRASRFEGMRILVALDEWPASSRYPRGHYVATLGKTGEKEVETKVALHEHDVASEEFSTAVLACLPRVDENNNYVVPDEVVAERRDLRHLLVCSIDPPNCRDIDDALSVVENESTVVVGVHIADVTHFCLPGTALDDEAKRRGTSTYLVDRRLDMLPQLLTEHVCSLKGNVDRLAFSALIELDKATAEVVSCEFVKSVIHSRAALSYHEAQLMISSDDRDPLAQSIRTLALLARKLRAKRMEAGALTLASPQVRFELCNESDSPTDVGSYTLFEANSTVEEFMLLANVCVARRILQDRPAILRHHPPPPQKNFDSLNLKLEYLQKPLLDVSSSKTLAESLDRVGKDLDQLVRIAATRCMAPAKYFKSSDSTDWLHYGLAAQVYTHFTSPIRRYADVIAHRQLFAVVTSNQIRDDDLSNTCNHLNSKNANAQYAARDSIKLYTTLYFKDKPPTQETAHVVDILASSKEGDSTIKLVVLLPRYGLEANVKLDSTDDGAKSAAVVHAKKDEQILAVKLLSGKGEIIKVFDSITVQIAVQRDNLDDGLIQVTMVSPVVTTAKSEDVVVADNEEEDEAARTLRPKKKKRKKTSGAKK